MKAGKLIASKPATVAIIHGWAEGGQLSKRLVRTLQQRGFTVIDDPSAADIVFAHSLGCYLVPREAKARLILLVGIPSGPTRLLPAALVRKLAGEVAHHRQHNELGWWGKKAAYGFWCAVSKPHHLYYVFTKRNPGNLPRAEGRTVMVIRPRHDPFVPENSKGYFERKDYKYKELKGMHDDCWLDPEVYAAIIESEWAAM